MRTLTILLGSLILFATPTEALARRRHPPPPPPRVVVVPPVRVVVSPWMFGYRPAPRAGWVWVEGYYDRAGFWIPGYWRPAADRPGYVWVPGYWDGDRYEEGYWREVSRPGFTWVEGYYDGGRWVPGYWAPLAPPPPPGPPPTEPPPPVHHGYED